MANFSEAFAAARLHEEESYVSGNLMRVVCLWPATTVTTAGKHASTLGAE